MQEVTIGMGERGISDLKWVDREGWRKFTLGTVKCENTKKLYINKLVIIISII